MTQNSHSSRSGIIRLISNATGVNVRGSLGHRSDHKLTSKDQMPHHLAERFTVSLILLRSAHYLAFVHGGGPVDISVAGAKFQDRSCAAGSVMKDSQGRTQYSGSQAAHIRLGSYLINGTPSASCWLNEFSELAAQKNYAKAEAGKNLPGLGHFAALSLLCEGRTRPVPALYNQVDGTIESKLHRHMNLLKLPSVPKDEYALIDEMIRYSYMFMEIIHPEMLQSYKEREVEITRDKSKERTQINVPIDGHEPYYNSEKDILERNISELESQQSATNQELDKVQNNIVQSVNAELPLLAAAKEEAQSG